MKPRNCTTWPIRFTCRLINKPARFHYHLAVKSDRTRLLSLTSRAVTSRTITRYNLNGDSPMRRITALPLSIIVLALALNAYAAGRDRLTIDTYLDWEYVNSPQVSPDGAQVVYTRRWTDKMNDKFEDEVWIMNADGTRNRFFVKGSQARWSPDGRRIAYVAPGQPGGAQIFVKWLDAAEESQVTHLERAPGNITWSPDGKSIAFTMLVPSTQTFKINMPSRPAGAKWIDAPRVVDRLDYRNDGSGWRPEGFAHLFLVSADGGTPR